MTMRPLIALISAALIATGILATTTVGATKKAPETIALPDGWQPEGIAAGSTLYVGSIPTGSIYKANAKTGEGDPLVEKTDRAAIGIKFGQGRIYVAGGPQGRAFVYDARTGADVANVVLTDAPTFVNDVTLTRDAAYFTDSIRQQLYRLDRDTFTATTIPITGDLQYDNDNSTFEANGIAATPNGKTLYVVQSRTGQLFAVDAKTGASKRIELTGGTLANGDGLLLAGKTLYVVQNRLNRIAVVDLTRRRITRTITDSDFRVPTTLAQQRGVLYAVNAKFGTTPTPDTPYEIVRVGKRRK